MKAILQIVTKYEDAVKTKNTKALSTLVLAQLLVSSKETIEEKFYNVNVTQDGPVAWVMMDHQTLRGGTVSNHGVETWQMFKPDGKTWKILSVVWSSYDGP